MKKHRLIIVVSILSISMLLFLILKRQDESSASDWRELYQEVVETFPDVPTLTASDAKGLIADKSVVFLDVRSPEERKISLIPGAISLEAFLARSEDYQNKKIITYCTIGYRSAMQTRALRSKGFEAYNLEGSLLSWISDNGPLVTPEGGSTKRLHVFGSKWNVVPDDYEAVY